MPLFSDVVNVESVLFVGGTGVTSHHESLVLVCGVDEAGRGPLVGSVVTAAVILDPFNPIEGLSDSKKLTERKRDELFDVIIEKALAYSICEATSEEIDQLNILQATMLAMGRAIQSLPVTPHQAWIDGNRCPKVDVQCLAFVKGDALHACISAASILAKVTRDRQLKDLDDKYPHYGFAKHKGYPTAAHLMAIEQYGVIDEHRRSYRPVREAIDLVTKK